MNRSLLRSYVVCREVPCYRQVAPTELPWSYRGATTDLQSSCLPVTVVLDRHGFRIGRVLIRPCLHDDPVLRKHHLSLVAGSPSKIQVRRTSGSGVAAFARAVASPIVNPGPPSSCLMASRFKST